MSNPSAISRKDMREPDRFQVVANQAAAWVAARKKLVATVGGIAVVAIVAVGVVLGIQNRQLEISGQATSGLLAIASAQVIDPAPKDSKEQTFPTEEAKNKAIVAEADKVLAAHGVVKGTLLAVMLKGDAHLALKEWDAAAAQFNRYLTEAPADDSLRFSALENLGLVAEQKGDLAGALAAYQRLAKEAPPFADRADLDQARVLVLQGKAEEAKQLLTKFGDNHPKSLLSREATQELQKLGGK
jgi:tetratricopeptide (TPR) repeat protein